MSYSNVYFHRKRSIMHYWEYDDNGEKQHRQCEPPLYFYSRDDNGDFKTIYGDMVKRVECSKWGEYKDRIRSYKDMGISIYESDVPIETKFIVQEYLGQELQPPNFDIHFMDIEVHSEEGFPDPDYAEYPITIIAVWSTKDDKFYIFSEREFDDSFIEENNEVFVFDSEEELLKAYIKFTYTSHPDIISGWNSNGFDIPYIMNRAKNILGERWAKRMSPIGVVKEREYHITETKTQIRYEIAGISCLDMLEVYKNYTFSEKENYRLGYIASLEIGATKLEYEGTIVDLYADWQQYVEYNIQDTRLLRQLEDKLGYIKMLINFCYGCRVPFEHFDRTTRVLDGAFISELAKEGIVLPDVNRELKDVKYPGGFVKDPLRGMHDWIISFDATSLYPSIMMNWNISPETKVGVINDTYLHEIHKGLMANVKFFSRDRKKDRNMEMDTSAYDNLHFEIDKDQLGPKFNTTVTGILEIIDSKTLKSVNEWGGVHGLLNEKIVIEIQKGLNGKEFENLEFIYEGEITDIETMIDYLKDNNYCIACNGVVYRQDFQGVIPRFVENWFNQRKNYKNKMLAAKDMVANCESEKDKEEWKGKAQLYDLLQLNFKILINSVYGYLGTVYSRLYDFDNCVAVCINGQNITRKTANTLDTFFEKKFGIKDVVVYGDTDSVYLRFRDVFKKLKIPNLDARNEDEINEIIFKYISVDGNPKCVESVTTNVIQKSMKNLTMTLCNCSDNKIFFKREAVARNGIFLERKRYVAWVLNDEGVRVNKLKSTGVDIVRSSTPIIVQGFLKNIVFDILKKADEKFTKTQVGEARNKFMESKPEDIAKPTGIRTYEKYISRMERGDFKSIPSQVRGAFAYNNVINSDKKLKQKYEEIFEGDKMKMLYMKTDRNWRDKAIGFKDKWISELGIEHLIDKEKQLEVVFVNPLLPFYEIMGWDWPNFKNEDVNDLFDW